MRAILIAVAVTLVVLSLACGGGSSTSTPTGSQAIGSATVTTTQGADKTVTPLHESASVAATAPGETPTTPPVSAEGTPAVQPSDQDAFLAQFQGAEVDLQTCEHTPGTAIVDCSGVLYAIDPPIVGQDVQCSLWLVAGTPRALGCSSAEPVQTTYYEIQ